MSTKTTTQSPTPAEQQAVAQAIAVTKSQITDDIARGTVPATVASWGELNEHVDGNAYGDAEDMDYDLWVDVTTEIDAWLADGRPEPVTVGGHQYTAQHVTRDGRTGVNINTCGVLQDEIVRIVDREITYLHAVRTELDLPVRGIVDTAMRVQRTLTARAHIYRYHMSDAVVHVVPGTVQEAVEMLERLLASLPGIVLDAATDGLL